MNKSYLIAAVLTLALVLWLASGYLLPASDGEAAPSVAAMASQAQGEDQPMRVTVRQQSARPVTREIIVQGQTEANRVVTLRAETSGQVTAVVADKGQRLETGDVIIRLAMNDRLARLRQAQALLAQRQADYQAFRSLRQTGYQAETRLNEAEAQLEAARAELARIELDIENTAIRAPIEAVLNERSAEFGDFIAVNDPVATLVDIDPLVVAGQVPQQTIDQVKVGRVATVRFISGQEASGIIRYISTQADAATRTFRVELEIPNPDREYVAGVSTEIRIPIETVPAHLLSPALLSLDEEGVLGVKSVDPDSRVLFHPVSIVRTAPDGVWLAGLPEQARIITIGQGFVQPGEQVTAVPESATTVDEALDTVPTQPVVAPPESALPEPDAPQAAQTPGDSP